MSPPQKDKPFNPGDREALEGLLAAVRSPPSPVALSEKLSNVEIFRKWFVHFLCAAALCAAFVWRCAVVTEIVKRNTEIADKVKDLPERMTRQEKKMRQIRPLVRKMNWQVEQGLTNADLKEKGIVPPDFPEEE